MARSLTTRSTNPKIMDDNIKILDDALAVASTPPAEDVSYDNTDSGLTADDVQTAIDEINGELNSIICSHIFPDVTFPENGLKRIDNDSSFNTIVGSSDQVIRAQTVDENVGYAIIIATWGNATYLALKGSSDMATVGNVTIDVKVIYSSKIKNVS